MRPLVKLEKWAIGFVTEADLGGRPAACEACSMFLSNQERCSIIGPDVIIAPFKIEEGLQLYTPVCSQQDPGKPMEVGDEDVRYVSTTLGPVKADEVGLEWAKGTGTNCGGKYGAAACTAHYSPEDGGCRPLQSGVSVGDCCAAHKGTSIPWRDAQKILRA